MSKQTFNTYLEENKDEFNINSVFNLIKSGGSITWSWGASNFKNFYNRALTFSVNGFKHKGIVAITYNKVPDLFNVELRTSHYNLMEEVNDVYIDQLIDVIDYLVETENDKSDDYRNKVESAIYNI